MNLLPCPRFLKRTAGSFTLPRKAAVCLDHRDREIRLAVRRLKQTGQALGVQFIARTLDTRLRRNAHRQNSPTAITAIRSESAPRNPEGYHLGIRAEGVRISYRSPAGFRMAVATLRQLFREYGRRLPCLDIRDWPDFPRRGVMLDVSRGRVPKLSTLLDLVDQLADFKINEFQLYFEHTFAYRKYRRIWRSWGALTGREMSRLDHHCRALGIDLVPNQNSFGHLREWLADSTLKHLGEVSEPYEGEPGGFLRHPSTLAPARPVVLKFLRDLYDELLPHFSSRYFNVGCDETWDLGRGRSRRVCATRGQGRVYLDHLKAVHREVQRRGRIMMFWGDIILRYPQLIRELPRPVVALNWGYEASHPFDREARKFSRAGIPFYVCPGTSTWQTLVGRHDNAFKNLVAAARAGRRHKAQGYLITDWGDGGHPQPLAVSLIPYLVGASLSWCQATFRSDRVGPVLSRDVFADPTGRLAAAALGLGLAHQKLRRTEPNATPLGTVIAAPPPERRELFCRNGLQHFASIRQTNILAALAALEKQRARIRRARPGTRQGAVFALELDLAARMAAQSCRFMLWQQAVSRRQHAWARGMARKNVAELRSLDRQFKNYWPLKNKGSTAHCASFLQWRVADYLGRRRAQN